MSEFLSGMVGTDVMAEVTGTTAKPSSQISQATDSNGFPAVFTSLTENPVGSEAVLSGMLDPADPALLLASFIPNEPVTTGAASFSSMANYGNTLPYGQPLISVSGHIANSTPEGASAMTFVGDGQTILLSTPQKAANIPMAMQAANQQVDEALNLPKLMTLDGGQQAFPVVDAIKRSDLALLTAIPDDVDFALTSVPLSSLTSTHAQAHSLPAGLTTFDNTLAAQMSTKPEAMTSTLQQPQWNQEVGERINWMIAQGLKQAEIRLNPPELGLLEVRIQVQGDQANVQFSSPHAQVRDALDAALPRLREMLAETGLSLADANISQHSFRDQNTDSEQQSGQQNSEYGQSDNEGTAGDITTDKPIVLSGRGILDVFA